MRRTVGRTAGPPDRPNFTALDTQTALSLLAAAVPAEPGVWADLGAGSGTFTRALVELLGPTSRIYAVDRDAGAVKTLARWAEREAPNVVAVRADITEPFVLPDVRHASLDGLLLANVLHYVADPAPVLRQLGRLLGPRGRVVVIEYDRRAANPWVPYPIPIARLAGLFAESGFTAPTITGRRPSAFSGDLYVAVMERR
ncbi:MAG TPA: methyltransferase [Gemmatimonadales bacterium]|nr:methyltransferase [Gemmatimonadales bacterium]